MAEKTDRFNNVEDLYRRLQPAFKAKIDELRREKINYINEKDIWNYCLKNRWGNKSDLRLYEMVDDILNIDIFNLDLYVKKNNN